MPTTAEIPDLSMWVERAGGPGVQLVFELRSRLGLAGANGDRYPIQLAVEPREFLARHFDEIENLALDCDYDQARVFRDLEARGGNFFRSLLPEGLRETLWELRDQVETLIIVSEVPGIPWELFRFRARKGMPDAEGRFFAEQFALTYGLPGFGERGILAPRYGQLHDFVMMAHPGSDFQDERATIEALGNISVTNVRPQIQDVARTLGSDHFDVFHFTGHGLAVGDDPERWFLLIGDTTKLSFGEVRDALHRLDRFRPLIFLNACTTGRFGLALRGFEGWVSIFLEAGASVFIGTHWEVPNDAARLIASSFYRRYLEGMLPLGEAFRRTRIELREAYPDDPTWLAYTVYGHPASRCGDGPQSVRSQVRPIIALTSSRPSSRPLFTVPYQRNPFFTGREGILANLRATLLDQPTSQGHTTAISGLGGIGKTQTAVEYAYRHREEYPAGVFFVRADTKEELTRSYADLAGQLGIATVSEQEIMVEAARRWLDEHKGWLLIIDNADAPLLVRSYLPPPGHRGHVIVTTRAANLDTLGIRKPERMETLLPEEALELLLARAERDLPSASERIAAASITENLGHLPLALEQAGAYILEHSMRFADYLERLRSQGLEALERGAPVVGEHESVARTWLLNFAHVKSSSPAAAEALQASAFLAPDEIPLEILVKESGLFGRSVAEALGDATPAEVLAPLLVHSLIQRDVEAETFSVHRLVQEVVRASLRKAETGAWVERTVKAINSSLPAEVTFEDWVSCERLLPHALAVIRWVKEWSRSARELHDRIGVYLFHRGRYTEAERLFQRVLRFEPHVASALDSLAELYRLQGRLAEAEPLLKRSLHVKKVIPHHPSTATTLNNLALIFHDQRRFAEAESYYQRALRIKEDWAKLQGEDQLGVATTLNNLANLHREQGNYAKAETLYKRALRMKVTAHGEEHPDTGIACGNLAQLYIAQRSYTKAEPFIQRALSILEEALGFPHPHLATSLEIYAKLLRATDRPEQAAELEMRAREIRTLHTAQNPRQPPNPPADDHHGEPEKGHEAKRW